jgi:hypothetical protein
MGHGSGYDREAAAQADKNRMAASLATGAASTLLTGGQGIQDQAEVRRNKLFGE